MTEQALTEKQAGWLTHLKRCEAQGLSLVAYGEAHGIAPQKLYQWRSTLKQKGLLPGTQLAPTASPWLPVVSKAPAAGRCLLRLPNGLELEWDAAYPLQSVMQLIESVCPR